MGYETHVVIGHLKDPEPEYEEDKDNPFDDGSGYPYKRDENGNLIPTGHTKRRLQPYANLHLCKISNSVLGRLHARHLMEVKKNGSEFVFFYHSDGNTEFTKDNYGDPLVPVPLAEVLEVVRKDAEENDYRRFQWLKALLESMKDDPEELTCAFYGS